MKAVNLKMDIIKKFINIDKSIIVAQIVPYKNNTKLKLYSNAMDEYPNEPLADIPDEDFEQYKDEDIVVMCIKEGFNDDTGEFEITFESFN